jgi:unsaturated rhamnogalacturonyl hydrolase
MTALIASGFIKGYRMGYLDSVYLEAGKKAFHAVVDAIQTENGHLYMPEVSGPTIPMPLFPYLGYKWIPRGKNWSYGIAALIFAAIEYDALKKV